MLGVNVIPLEIGFGILGALVGLGSGWLGVKLEVIEKLEAEELEERKQYEADTARAREEAETEGKEFPEPLAWISEKYGWTRLEYVLSPVLGAFSFALFAGHDGLKLMMFEHLLWISVFIHIVAFDIKHRLILNKITYPSVVVALILSVVTPGLSLKNALVGGAVIAAFFLIFSLLSRGGIGLGDAKLGALIGAVTGLSFDNFPLGDLQALTAVIDAVFLGGITALFLLVTRLRSMKDPIPYGPFLCAGAAIVLYSGMPVT